MRNYLISSASVLRFKFVSMHSESFISTASVSVVNKPGKNYAEENKTVDLASVFQALSLKPNSSDARYLEPILRNNLPNSLLVSFSDYCKTISKGESSELEKYKYFAKTKKTNLTRLFVLLLFSQGLRAKVTEELTEIFKKMSKQNVKTLFSIPRMGHVILECRDGYFALSEKCRIEWYDSRVLFRPLKSSDETPVLSAENVANVKSVFRSVNNTAGFNRMASPLAFIRFYRDLKEMDSSVTLKDAFAIFRADGALIHRTYGGGDCITISQEISRQAFQQTPNLALDIIAQYNETLAKFNDPILKGFKLLMKEALRDESTHADLLLAAKDTEGKYFWLHMITGHAVTDEKTFEEIQELKTTIKLDSYKHPRAKGEVVAVANPEYLHKLQIRMRPVLYVKKTIDAEEVFGVDLINGDIFLNTAASETQTLFAVRSGEQVSMSFRTILSSAQEREKTTTLDFCDPETKDVKRVELSQLEGLYIFIAYVQKAFNLPEAFVADTLFLLSNAEEYCRDILFPPIQVIIESLPQLQECERAYAAVKLNEDNDPDYKLRMALTAAADKLRETFYSGDKTTVISGCEVFLKFCGKLPK